MRDIFSVRFGADLIANVRHFARQDGVTASQWVRKLVEREIKNPQRQPAVDVSLYPWSQTVSSGAGCRFTLTGPRPPESVTY